jgi:hypothetical protein
MLLRAEDEGEFHSEIVSDSGKVWASYSIEGRVRGQPMTQSDRRFFASQEEARIWLVGEADQRGFHNFAPEERTTA